MQVSISNCARCGEAHDELEARTFARPFAPAEAAPITWTHWVPCPTNGDPILITCSPRADGRRDVEIDP